MDKFINIHISVHEDLYDLSYAYLTNYHFTGIEERINELVISFPLEYWQKEASKSFEKEVLAIDESVKVLKKEVLGEKNWNEEWEKHIEPVVINENIGIAPSWRINELKTKYKIAINPKMSFGTGSHPSTWLIARMIEKYLKKGEFWIDVGAGTGILSILAAMLGAKNILAIENNNWALENAKENIKQNFVSSYVELISGDIEEMALPGAEGIAANLFINLIIPSFEKFHQSLKEKGGILLIAGVLAEDKKILNYKAKTAGFSHLETTKKDGWISIAYKAE